MGSKILVVLFGVFVLGIVIYAINSNIVGKLSSPFGSLFRFSTSSWFPAASTTLSSPPPRSYVPPPPPAVAPPQNATSTIPASEIPQGFTLEQLSPYFKKITLSGAWAGTYSSYGEITLASNGLSASDTVNITGWRITTNRGGLYVPQAINIYDPSGLTAPGDIILRQNQYVYIYSSSGPFNLRLNKCIGYIAKSNKFTPPIPPNCPYIDQSSISKMGFTGACINYISSLPSCTVPDLNNIAIPATDYACRDYLANDLNYKACFNVHQNDADFLSNQWWVWMGSTPLDPFHDTVNLFDRNGLLVDQYTY